MAKTGTIGAKIVLEGEAAYRKALRDIKTEQSQLRSEMRLASAQYADNQNSIEALQKKHEVLAKQVEASKKKVEAYQKAIELSAQKEEQASKKITELEKSLNEAQNAYDEMQKSGRATNEELEAQQKVIDKVAKELETASSDYDKAAEATKKYQTQMNLAQAETETFERNLRDTDKYLEEASKSADGCAKSIDEYGKEVSDAKEETIGFGDVLKANLTSEAIISAVKALARGIKDVATACIETGSEFEASMSNVQALSGATGSELEKLTEKAKEMGATTIYSASESADAFSYMALAGWDVTSMLEGISPILSLAAASNMDLATASDIVTDNLTAFGLSAKDAAKFSDQMAYAMSHSNTDVEQLGEAYKNCAASAASMNYSVEDVTAALMTMANAGVKGGEAGTSLRAIMINLATNTNNCADKLHKYGVEIYDNEGKMRSLSSILVDMSGVFENLSEEESNALAKTVAGKTQYTGLQTVLLGLSEAAKESGMSLEDYSKALESCDGAAEQMANTMQDNLKGKLTQLGSALDGLKIATYEIFDDKLKSGVESASNAVSRLSASVSNGAMNASLSKLSDSLGKLIDKTSTWAEKNLPKIIDGLAGVIDNADKIAAAVKGVLSAVAAYKAVGVAMTAYEGVLALATIAQNGFNASVMANPIGLLAAALAGVTVAMVSYYKANEDAIRGLTELDVRIRNTCESSEALNKSIKNSADARAESQSNLEAQEGTVRNLVDKLTEMQTAYKNGADNMTEMRSVVDQLNQAMPGLNLTIDENTGELSQNTEEILKNVDALAKQARYEAAKEGLAQIVKDQYEAEKNLYQLRIDQADALEELNTAQQKYDDYMNNHKLTLRSSSKDYQEVNNALINANIAYVNVNKAIEETESNLESLSGEYEVTATFIEQTTPEIESMSEAISDVAESTNEATSSMTRLSEEAQEALDDMYESVYSTIKSQVYLFDEVKEQEKVSTEELKKNLDEQVEALNNWADNLDELAQRGIDDNLYAKLAQMGPEGAAYAQAFVDMSDEELQKYGDKFKEAVQLEEGIANEIRDDYAKVAGYVVEGYANGIAEGEETIRENGADIGKWSEEATEEELEINSPSKVYEGYGKYVVEGFANGIDDQESRSRLSESVSAMSTEVVETTDGILAEGDFETMGMNIDIGLANGITSGTDTVTLAMRNMCTSAITEAQKTLQIHSPSKIFAWMGEMSGAGYIEGLQDSMNGVSDVMQGVVESANSVGAFKPESGSGMSDLINLLSEYLPEIASADNNVTVSLEGDANGLFNAIRKQNSNYRRSTGRSAFA